MINPRLAFRHLLASMINSLNDRLTGKNCELVDRFVSRLASAEVQGSRLAPFAD